MAEPTCFTDARAAAIALGAAARTGAEELPLECAAGRTAARDVAAPIDLPGFDGSAMDGYAVRAADTAGASAERPAALRIVDEARAGRPAGHRLEPGEATRISTGAAIPAGADAVVRQEDADEDGDDVRVRVAVPPRHDVRAAGEDVAAGRRILTAGEHLHPGRIALLGGAGVDAVWCHRRPTATVVVTGDEVIPAGTALTPGDVHDVNGIAVPALLRAAGADVVAVVRVGDGREATEHALATADADLIVTCGGVSVGRHDHVRAALLALGATPVAAGVALQPGGPTWIGALPGGPGPRGGDDRRPASRNRARPVLALPGNPGAALVTAALLVAPAVRAMGGRSPRPTTYARLAAATRADAHRTRALRAITERQDDGTRRIRVLEGQQPHRLTSLAEADALALVPPTAAVPGSAPSVAAGTIVEVVALPGADPAP